MLGCAKRNFIVLGLDLSCGSLCSWVDVLIIGVTSASRREFGVDRSVCDNEIEGYISGVCGREAVYYYLFLEGLVSRVRVLVVV